jgi:thymidylate kinase
MAAAAADRYRIIDASRPLDLVQQQLLEALAPFTP